MTKIEIAQTPALRTTSTSVTRNRSATVLEPGRRMNPGGSTKSPVRCQPWISYRQVIWMWG
jgi:hypothetical protein